MADIKTPNRIMQIHISRKCLDFKSADKPKQPQTTYAAAKGAVIVLVIPAAKSPMAKNCFENRNLLC